MMSLNQAAFEPSGPAVDAPRLAVGDRVQLSGLGRMLRPNKKRWWRLGTVAKLEPKARMPVWVRWDQIPGGRLRRYDLEELQKVDHAGQ